MAQLVRVVSSVIFLISSLTASCNGAGTDFEQKCLAFVPADFITNATVNVHQYIPAGTTVQLPDDPCTTQQLSNVEVCRIALNITTSASSATIFEAWFPSNWTGRFLATGNGGINGCIKYHDIDYGTMNGFATVGSNAGHNGTGGLPFYQNDEVLQDYVWRSVHVITEVGKVLTNAFYASTFNQSYYIGCSGGGRQGIKAAEMFPDDFDGIVVGAPAVDFNNMSSWRASFFGFTGAPDSPDFISASTWSGLIHNEVLKQCDAIDGVTDGIIEDPELCQFSPDALLCTGQGNSTCLTSAQVEIVKKIFAPMYGADGELAFPGMQPGSEISAATGLYAGAPWPYSLDWFRYVVYDDPTWDDSNFTTADITAAQALNPFDVQTWPSDLSSFSDSHNGKLLIFHGQQDNQITSFNTARFYNYLTQTHPDIDSFLRYFRMSGMYHCNNGPGAWMVGQATSGDTGFNPESNVLAAMVQWVEEGVAPETIEGTKYVNDNKALGVSIKRKHCRYPLRTTYVSGNASLAESWTCAS